MPACTQGIGLRAEGAELKVQGLDKHLSLFPTTFLPPLYFSLSVSFSFSLHFSLSHTNHKYIHTPCPRLRGHRVLCGSTCPGKSTGKEGSRCADSRCDRLCRPIDNPCVSEYPRSHETLPIVSKEHMTCGKKQNTRALTSAMTIKLLESPDPLCCRQQPLNSAWNLRFTVKG